MQRLLYYFSREIHNHEACGFLIPSEDEGVCLSSYAIFGVDRFFLCFTESKEMTLDYRGYVHDIGGTQVMMGRDEKMGIVVSMHPSKVTIAKNSWSIHGPF